MVPVPFLFRRFLLPLSLLLALGDYPSFAAAEGLRAGEKAAAAQTAKAKVKAKTRARMRTKTRDIGVDTLTPASFMVISSPAEHKICYTEIKDFKSKNGVVSPLIDSGLLMPKGIAIDRVRGFLYVTDLDQKSIFRYKLMILTKPPAHIGAVPDRTLMTDGVQLTIVSGIESSWVAVDPQRGHLYFTDEANDAVSRLDYAVIEKIESGEWSAGDLQQVEEKKEETIRLAEEARRLQNRGLVAPPPPDAKPEIHRLYAAPENSGISRPQGVVTDGVSLVWANGAAGTTEGSVVEGRTNPVPPPVAPDAGEGDDGEPTVPTGVVTFPRKIATNANQLNGVAITHNAVVYTDNTQFVYGVRKGGGAVVSFGSGLQAPRGLVWDGDGTVYVADRAGNMVYAFASGSLAATSFQQTVGFHDAFGLALLGEEDPAWATNNQVHAAADRRAKPICAALAAVFGVTLYLRAAA